MYSTNSSRSMPTQDDPYGDALCTTYGSKTNGSLRIQIPNTTPARSKESSQMSRELKRTYTSSNNKQCHMSIAVDSSSTGSSSNGGKSIYKNVHKSCKISISSNYNKNFNKTTNIIAERIVNKQLEFKSKSRYNSQGPMKLDKLSIRRTLHNEIHEVTSKLPVKVEKRKSYMNINMLQQTLPKLEMRKTKPKFILSTNRTSPRFTINHVAAQVNFKNSNTTVSTQTHSANLSSSLVQVGPRFSITDKKLQTRMFKSTDEETNTISAKGTSRCTNTCHQEIVPKRAPILEYMSNNDLYCLQWIQNYLFDVKVNPDQIVLGEKLRDVSEVGTKSSLFTTITSGV